MGRRAWGWIVVSRGNPEHENIEASAGTIPLFSEELFICPLFALVLLRPQPPFFSSFDSPPNSSTRRYVCRDMLCKKGRKKDELLGQDPDHTPDLNTLVGPTVRGAPLTHPPPLI